ncbi:hypothetical protein G7A66_09950 [Altererythrobacter sp. SALINAS58]|uniref:hypothetical protein n=1 Tax=Alteripontixanthobacter muriae TaxID=2705546 RepID=UPI001576AF8C|nr:hypothetical protein [Alteripontixanthobacter muriae]NTZ43398.1 hypothetical protein [Alteripontixanthobacter muriae]
MDESIGSLEAKRGRSLRFAACSPGWAARVSHVVCQWKSKARNQLKHVAVRILRVALRSTMVMVRRAKFKVWRMKLYRFLTVMEKELYFKKDFV